MKKAITITAIAVMMFAVFALTSCGRKSDLVTDCSSDKSMTVEAKNAEEDNFVSVGTLVVDEGEQLVITPALEKGEIELGFVGTEGEQSVDELPDIDADADYSVKVSGEDVQTLQVSPGSYQIKVTPTEKTTGTIKVDVKAK